jgi:Tol biopolymer transport system component
MKARRLTLLLVLAMLTGGVFAQQVPSADVLLKAAMQREQVDGDLAGAIDQYKAIVSKYADNRPVAATALLHIGQCYERLGKPEAASYYDRVVREYADSGAAVTAARARLATFQSAVPAAFKSRSLDAAIKSDDSAVYVSPDRKSIAYLRANGDRGTALCVRDLATGQERMLAETKTKAERISTVTWSSDSARIGYLVYLVGPASELRVVTVSRGESQVFYKADTRFFSVLRWSPDGQRLAFIVAPWGPNGLGGILEGRSFEIRLMAVGSAESQIVATVAKTEPGERPPTWAQTGLTWSPDSRKLAWLAPATDAQVQEIHTLTIATREARALTLPQPAKSGTTTLTSWTPKDELFFSQSVPGAGNDFFLIAAGGGQARKICEGRGSSGGDGCSELSPDGTLLVTRKNVEGGGRTMLRDVTTGTERPLTTASVMEQPAGVGFSPDGRLIAFKSHRDGKWGLYVVPLSQIPVANPILVASLESSASNATGWWTDSGLVAKLTHSETNVFRINVDAANGRPSGTLQRLTQDNPTNNTPFVSPDGRRIAYVAQAGGRSGIAVIDATGARERFVVDDIPIDLLRRVQVLGWRSAEDILLAEPTARAGREPGFKTLNIRTGELKDFQPFPADIRRSETTLMSQLWYAPAKQDYLYNPLDSGKPQWSRYRSPGGIDVAGLEDLVFGAVSPDGRLLVYAYETNLPGTKPGPNQPYLTGLRLKPLNGGPERELTRDQVTTDAGFVVPKCFSPDGKFVLYSDHTNTLRIMNVATAESWLFLDEKQGDVSFEWTDADWSPDGSFIVLTGTTTRTEWRAFDGLTYDAVTKILKSSGK